MGFVDWLDRGLIYGEKSLEMCICLWPELDCPQVTLCGWQDIKIQLLLLHLSCAHQRPERSHDTYSYTYFKCYVLKWILNMRALKYVQTERIYLFKLLFSAYLSNILMYILLHLLIWTALRAHISVVQALYKINHYYINLNTIFYTHVEHSPTKTIYIR